MVMMMMMCDSTTVLQLILHTLFWNVWQPAWSALLFNVQICCSLGALVVEISVFFRASGPYTCCSLTLLAGANDDVCRQVHWCDECCSDGVFFLLRLTRLIAFVTKYFFLFVAASRIVWNLENYASEQKVIEHFPRSDLQAHTQMNRKRILNMKKIHYRGW